jgi:hypothetical protein
MSAGTGEDLEEEDILHPDPDPTPALTPEGDTEGGEGEEDLTLPDPTLLTPDQEEEREGEEEDLLIAERALVLSAERAVDPETPERVPIASLVVPEVDPRLPEDQMAPRNPLVADAVTDQPPQLKTQDPRVWRRSREADPDLPTRRTEAGPDPPTEETEVDPDPQKREPDQVPSPPRSLTK